MKSKEEILRLVCGYDQSDPMLSDDDVTVSEALEAMVKYARQYIGMIDVPPQPLPEITKMGFIVPGLGDVVVWDAEKEGKEPVIINHLNIKHKCISLFHVAEIIEEKPNETKERLRKILKDGTDKCKDGYHISIKNKEEVLKWLK